MPATRRELTEDGPLAGRLTGRRVVATWGLVVTSGWIVTQLILLPGTGIRVTPGGLTAFWLVGALVPIVVSALWMRKDGPTGLFPAWTVLGVTGLVVSFAVAGGQLRIDGTLAFGVLWFVGPAVGFFVTARYMIDWSRRLYAVAGVANLVAAAVVFSVPAFVMLYPGVAAVLQGTPMVYHAIRLD